MTSEMCECDATRGAKRSWREAGDSRQLGGAQGSQGRVGQAHLILQRGCADAQEVDVAVERSEGCRVRVSKAVRAAGRGWTHLATERFSLGGCPISITRRTSSSVYSPATRTRQPSVKRPSPGVCAKGRACQRAPGQTGPFGRETHGLVHVEHDPTVAVLEAQQAFCRPTEHAEQQEALVRSAE